MPHPNIDNDTPLVLEPLFLLDEDGAPALTAVVKASFAIEAQGLVLLAEQPGLVHGGEPWFPDAELSSDRLEPEIAPIKLATDVAVVARAWAPTVGTEVLEVGARVGPLEQRAWVFGDRAWVHAGLSEPQLSRPIPFESVPLCYERAFGGVDDRRNPLGRGHRPPRALPEEGELAPNIEDPRAPITGHRDRPAPVGFGFVSPHWLPRAELAGTYDDHWREQLRPALPPDFDPRFHNGASPGLVAPGYLRGDEPVELFKLSPEGYLSFALPGLPPPSLRLRLSGRPSLRPELALDTVIIDVEARTLTLFWRARVGLDSGPHDLLELELRSPAAASFPRREGEGEGLQAANTAPRAQEHLP